MEFNRNRKKIKPNQNILDYVLTNYGSLNYLQQFLTDNPYTDIDEFEVESINTSLKVTDVNNYVVNNYYNIRNIVATGKFNKGEIEVICEFSLDFSLDFTS